MKRRIILVMAMGLGLSVLLAACAKPATQAMVTVTDEPAPAETSTAAPGTPTREATEAEGGAEEAQDQTGTDNPKSFEVMNQVPLVQHHHNTDTGVDTFTCASWGLGVNGVEPDLEGPRYVGPNAGDFDLRGAVGLFEVNSDGSIFFVPQQTGGKFLDADGVEQERYTLGEALPFFASGEARWIGGQHGDPGRVADCDPQFPRED